MLVKKIIEQVHVFSLDSYQGEKGLTVVHLLFAFASGKLLHALHCKLLNSVMGLYGDEHIINMFFVVVAQEGQHFHFILLCMKPHKVSSMVWLCLNERKCISK